MKITTRTPPVRIEAARLLAIARLPAEYAGMLLQMGMIHYGGGAPLSIQDARTRFGYDEHAWRMFIQSARGEIEQDELEEGKVVVTALQVAAESRDILSKARSVRHKDVVVDIKAKAATGTDGMVVQIARTPKAPPPPPEASPWDAIAGALVARGATAVEVETAIAGWRKNHVVGEVMDAMQMLSDRRVAKPVKYLDTILTKTLATRRQSMPTQIRLASQGAILPRSVKRRIAVTPRTGWSFEGWTARGHPRGGVTVEQRREVWRNDAGTLSYTVPQPETIVPNYEEDPGVYEGE